MEKDKIRLKNNSFFLISLVILLSVAYVLPLLKKDGILCGDDMLFHYTRLKMLASEIKLGNYFPAVYHQMFNGYGYAAGIFYPSLLIYPFAFLNSLGVKIIPCIMLFYVTVNILTSLSFFFCSRAIFKDLGYKNYNFKGFIVFLIQLADVYKLYNYYGRAAWGEFSAMIFTPIIVLGVYYIFKHKKKPYILGLGMAGLLFCHILSFEMACMVLLVVYLYNIKKIIKNPKIFSLTLLAAVQCAALSSCVWLPIIESMIKNDLLISHTSKLFLDGMSSQCWLRIGSNEILGFILTAVFILYSVFCKDAYSRLIQISLFALFFYSDLFPWDTLSLIKPIESIQFPWRFSSIFYFTAIYYLYLVVKTQIESRKQIVLNNSEVTKKSFKVDFILFLKKFCSIASVFIFLSFYCFINIKESNFPKLGIASEWYCERVSSAGLLEYVPYDLALNNQRKTGFKNDAQAINEVEYTIEELNPGKKVSFVKNFIKSGYEIEYETEDNEICVPIINYTGYETDVENTEISTTKYGFMKISNIPNNGTIKITYKGTLFQKLAWIGPNIYVMGIIIFLIAQKKKTRP